MTFRSRRPLSTAATAGAAFAVLLLPAVAQAQEPELSHVYTTRGVGAYATASACSAVAGGGTVCEATYVAVAERAQVGDRTVGRHLIVQQFTDTYDAEGRWRGTRVRAGDAAGSALQLRLDRRLATATATAAPETLVCVYNSAAESNCFEGGPTAVSLRWTAVGAVREQRDAWTDESAVATAVLDGTSSTRSARVSGSAFERPLPAGTGQLYRAEDGLHVVSRGWTPRAGAPSVVRDRGEHELLREHV